MAAKSRKAGMAALLLLCGHGNGAAALSVTPSTVGSGHKHGASKHLHHKHVQMEQPVDDANASKAFSDVHAEATASDAFSQLLRVGSFMRTGQFDLLNSSLNVTSVSSVKTILAASGGASWLGIIIGWFVSCLPVLVFALFYRHYKANVMSFVAPVEKDEFRANFGMGSWAVGLCDCCQAPGLFLFSCCCPVVRWADTMAMAGFFGFMCGVMSLLGVYGLSSLTGLYFIGIVYLVYHRQRLRYKFGIEHKTCATISLDTLAYMFCFHCAITQEARQTELGLQVGAPEIFNVCGESWEQRLDETLQNESARFSGRKAPRQQSSPTCAPVCCSGV